MYTIECTCRVIDVHVCYIKLKRKGCKTCAVVYRKVVDSNSSMTWFCMFSFQTSKFPKIFPLAKLLISFEL